MRPSNLLTSLALFTALTTAWPSGWDPLGTAGARRIRARQNNNNNNNDNGDETTSKFDLSISTEQGNTATTEQSSRGDSSASSGGDNNDNKSSTGKNDNSGKNSATTGKDSDSTGKSGDKTTANESTRTFDPRLPAGGIEMVTPNALAGAQYYKIKDYVTFGFNFTSLSVTPSAIDILATCSLNSATYTIASNHSVTQGADAVQAVTWDTGEYQATASTPLLLGTYTLMIHDAAKDVDATPQAGYLGTWEQFTFGMYLPQPYTPLADYVCATCNAAVSRAEVQTLGFLAGMVGLTVLSFGWFAGVAGVW